MGSIMIIIMIMASTMLINIQMSWFDLMAAIAEAGGETNQDEESEKY